MLVFLYCIYSNLIQNLYDQMIVQLKDAIELKDYILLDKNINYVTHEILILPEVIKINRHEKYNNNPLTLVIPLDNYIENNSQASSGIIEKIIDILDNFDDKDAYLYLNEDCKVVKLGFLIWKTFIENENLKKKYIHLIKNNTIFENLTFNQQPLKINYVIEYQSVIYQNFWIALDEKFLIFKLNLSNLNINTIFEKIFHYYLSINYAKKEYRLFLNHILKHSNIFNIIIYNINKDKFFSSKHKSPKIFLKNHENISLAKDYYIFDTKLKLVDNKYIIDLKSGNFEIEPLIYNDIVKFFCILGNMTDDQYTICSNIFFVINDTIFARHVLQNLINSKKYYRKLILGQILYNFILISCDEMEMFITDKKTLKDTEEFLTEILSGMKCFLHHSLFYDFTVLFYLELSDLLSHEYEKKANSSKEFINKQNFFMYDKLDFKNTADISKEENTFEIKSYTYPMIKSSENFKSLNNTKKKSLYKQNTSTDKCNIKTENRRNSFISKNEKINNELSEIPEVSYLVVDEASTYAKKSEEHFFPFTLYALELNELKKTYAFTKYNQNYLNGNSMFNLTLKDDEYFLTSDFILYKFMLSDMADNNKIYKEFLVFLDEITTIIICHNSYSVFTDLSLMKKSKMYGFDFDSDNFFIDSSLFDMINQEFNF